MGALQASKFKTRLCVGSALLAVLAMPGAAYAADGADEAPAAELAPDAAPGGDAEGEGAIVVTAQRRAQSIMDVGINVTQLSADRLIEERVLRMADIKQLTTNLEVRESRPGGLGVITIRGVGMNDFTPASNPSTSVYFDGVYSPNIGTIGQQFFDLQAIEVLKGPQSTLYGRNATAGAITITSAAPTEDFSGYFTLGYGNYKNFEAEGAVSGKIGEGLTARLSVKTRQQYGGWVKNVLPGFDDFGEIHQVAVRAQLKWQMSDSFSVHAIFGYQHENDEPGVIMSFGRRLPGGSPTASTGFCPVSNAGMVDYNNTCASLFGAVRPSTDKRVVAENDSWNIHGQSYTGTLIAKYEADSFAVTSTTGYIDWYEFYHQSDSLPITEYAVFKEQKTWQISQDIQIASTGKRRLDWMVGAYFSSANIDLPTYVNAPIAFTNYFATHDADVRTAQAYAQFDFNLSPKVTLSAGARYLHEYDSKKGGTWTDTNLNQVFDPTDATAAYLEDSIKQDALTWKLGVNYRPTAATLIYGSVTHGFKSGGYIAPATASNNSQLLPYKGEHIYAFETGLKQSLWGDLVNINASIFYYKYKDLQTNQQQLVGNVNLNRFANVPKANIKGVDLELLFKPAQGLELRLGGGYLDTHVGAFSSGGVNFAPGNRFANAPKWSGSASFRYEVPLGDDLDMVLGGSVHHRSKAYANTENTPQFLINSDFTLVNGNLSFEMPSRNLSLSFWGKNLTNETYADGGYQNGSVLFSFINMPRTYGATISKRF